MKEPTSAIESFRNVFTISDRELIRIAGVDAFLFIQYLQLLLRIFVPLALIVLPVLLPINHVGGVPGITGLDSFAWPNVGVPQKSRRLWAHLLLAILVICWTCYNFYLALRKFVRLRQTILTMPEHRIRASATTILVQSIPQKWLTVPALDALYDVFPGGIREIWLNRDYEDLQEKVDKRTKIARALEEAESKLIIQCAKEHQKMMRQKQKQTGMEKQEEPPQEETLEASDAGMTSGNPHQIEQALDEVLNESASEPQSRPLSPDPTEKRNRLPIPIIGSGIHAVESGVRDVGHGVGKIGSKFVGGVRGAFVRREGQGSQQLDGADENPPTPISTDTEPRGHSTDTHQPLTETMPDQEAGGVDGATVSKASRTGSARPTSRMGALRAVKKSPLNPLRRMSDFASPQPYQCEGEEYPLETLPQETKYDHSQAYNESFYEDDENALWRKYVKPQDRETMRVPLLDKTWWPSLPLTGKKVDTIYYCRKELARLNYEIEQDQAHPEKYPLMNSAFIQFNHQVAAHMACQSLSHHIPQQMTPRTVEVNPNYVIWSNMKMVWWERYMRSWTVFLIIVVLVICWGIPISFSAALSQINTLTTVVPWLGWMAKLPGWFINFIQGVLPPAFSAILFAILPLILRFLATQSGIVTTGERELRVQHSYFAFVFIQLFLVMSIASGISVTVPKIVKDPVSIPQTLAQNLPKSANYFFSYMILQALSISSGTLLQIAAVVLLLISRFLDTTPRQKVSRLLKRPYINWGTMIPVYTNFGAIGTLYHVLAFAHANVAGLVYSVISPLIMIMMLLTFSLFWFTYRYQMIYVSYPEAETNGLIFSRAINQLFTGLYFMELCLIGLFFLMRDDQGNPACVPQAIIMVFAIVCTAAYQITLNRAFSPLYNYLPITFEDEAVERDGEFERAQAVRWKDKDEVVDEQFDREPAKATLEDSPSAAKVDSHGRDALRQVPTHQSKKQIWADKSRDRSRSRSQSHRRHSQTRQRSDSHGPRPAHAGHHALSTITGALKSGATGATKPLQGAARELHDLEAQMNLNPDAYLFSDTSDTLEDMEPEARQKLIKRAFQHPATRALQPAIWIPDDRAAGTAVARDEIERTAQFSQRIWITCVDARLERESNGKDVRVVYAGLPPDRDPFENVEV